MRYGYFVHPHLGGTFSLFRHLRQSLAFEVELQWIGRGPAAHAAYADPDWADVREQGFVAGSPDEFGPQFARSLVAELEARRFDGVFVNVLADIDQTNAVRFLPAAFKRVMIVHNITPGTYAAAGSIRDFVHATVGVSQRIRDDLVGSYGFDPDWTFTIWNAIQSKPRMRARPARRQGDPLKLLCLGRVEDAAKGVFWLPQILRALPESVRLTIAGDGPDLAELKRLCAPLGGRVTFLGAVLPSAVESLLAGHDALIAPSRFEGCPITLAEAMAAGCLPVTSRLRGITDKIIQDGVHGLLFSVGHAAAAAAAIAWLLDHPAEQAAMSAACAERAREIFSLDQMRKDYLHVLHEIEQAPRAVSPPLRIEDWHLPSGLRAGWRRFVPMPLKNTLRTLKERYAPMNSPTEDPPGVKLKAISWGIPAAARIEPG